MDVARANSEALDEVEDLISIVAAGYPMAQNGELFQSLCKIFQARAIFFLLGELDFDHYRWGLARSAQARRFYLRKLHEQGGRDPVFTALSRTESVFCAVAIGALELASEIAALSSNEWTRQGEYEEDYYYFRLVHELIAGDRDSAVTSYQGMSSALDGMEDARLALCEAFFEGDEADFWEAFEEFVEDRHQRAAIPHDDGRLIDEPWRAAFQYISVEAIGWLKLAERTGYRPPEPEYKMCPAAAVNLPPGPEGVDVFLELEQQFGL